MTPPPPPKTPAWAARKLRHLDLHSPSVLSALHAVSASVPTAAAPFPSPSLAKHGRAAIQAASLDASRAVLASFAPVQAALAAVAVEVSCMRAGVAALADRLADARAGARDVVRETGLLRRHINAVAMRRLVAAAFVDRFVMGDEGRACLEGALVDAKFLDALARLERIHEQSRALLRCRNQTAGLEALEYAATTREDAYEKVLRFVQARCGELDVDAEEHEYEAALLRNAIRALRARPMLLRMCSEEVGSARRASLVARFVEALTTGGPGGVPRPIEMHAHDPMRYTNDMLAWMHQALASEKELMYRLFATTERGASVREEDERVREHNDDLAVKVLNTVFDALCRPFRIRFEQALEPSLPVVTLYRLASLLEFYAATMGALLGRQAALPEMLMECNSIAMYAFFSSWKSKMADFRSSGAGPSEELTPPMAVHQSMTRLDEIMATLDASLAPRDARQGQIGAILEVILNPLLSLCDAMAAKSQSALEARIFLANCIEAMRIPLAAYSFAAERVQQLALVADDHIDEYIRIASLAVLRHCGLAERVRIIAEAKAARAGTGEIIAVKGGREEAQGNEEVPEPRVGDRNPTLEHAARPLSLQPGMDVEALSIGVKNFYALLFGGSGAGIVDALSPLSVDKITNVRARNRAKEAVAKVLVDAHADISAVVLDPYNEYGADAVSIIGLRDGAKVTTMLTGR